MQKIILEGKKINNSFHSGEKKNHVLKDISLSVQAGEYLSIMGPSGSGKSTLLYAISGMDSVDSGEVQINGKQVVGLSEKAAAICRALINSPKIIFGDEPAGALNSKSSEEIIQLLQEIRNDGCTFILVTHDPKVVTSSNRVLFLKDGEIASDLKLEGIEEDKKRDLVLSKMKELDI